MNRRIDLSVTKNPAGSLQLSAHRRLYTSILVASALLLTLVIPFMAASATTPISEPLEAALSEASALDQAADADAARYTALAGYYLDKGADASSARLTALAEFYGAGNAAAEAASTPDSVDGHIATSALMAAIAADAGDAEILS